MTSELRPAVEVWGTAWKAWDDSPTCADDEAIAIIEADREAVRAEQAAEIERLKSHLEDAKEIIQKQIKQAAELAKFKALAETLAGALGEAVTWNSHDDEGVPAVWLDQADVALREYKGKTHVAVAQYKEARDV